MTAAEASGVSGYGPTNTTGITVTARKEMVSFTSMDITHHRLTVEGEHEFRWQEIAEPQDAATPRQQADVGELTAGVDNLSMSAESAESSYDDYSYEAEGGASEGEQVDSIVVSAAD